MIDGTSVKHFNIKYASAVKYIVLDTLPKNSFFSDRKDMI